MATKQYEYFGNQNPTMNGRMAPARVRAQNTANIAADQKNWATDPWFTLGSTIGQAWADNYNERGVMKGRNEMNDALNGYLGQFAQQPQSEVEQGGVLNNVMPGSTPSEEMLNNNSAQIQGGVANGIDNMIAPISPQDAYKAYKNDAWVAKYRGDDPNPDSTAIAVKNDTREMNQLGDNVDFSKVDKEQAREYVRQQLEAKGRTPYQIDQVLGQFDNVYDSKYGKWKETKGTSFLQNGINALNGDNPDYNTAFANLATAAEYDNPQAKMYLQRMQDMQRRQDVLDKEKRDRDWQMQMLNYRASLGGGARGSRGGGGSTATGSGVAGVLSDGTPYNLDMAKLDVDILHKAQGADPNTSEGKAIIAMARLAGGRLAQMGYGISFNRQGQPVVTEEPKSAPRETYGFNVTNTDDDNRESEGPGVFSRIGNFFGGLVPEANTSGQARGWANGEFGPSLAERVLGYDPKKKDK